MANQKHEHLRAGVGRVEITPPLGTPLTGYPDPYYRRRAESVRDPLHATALVIEHADERVALISIDVALIDDGFVELIRQGVHERTGIEPASVIVGAIHTHSAPRTHVTWGWGEPNQAFVHEQMIPGAIEAAAVAASRPAPVRLGIATCHSEVAVNRRGLNQQHQAGLGLLHWGLVDPQMTVLRFEGAAGTVANLVHYGAHPTVLGKDSRAISRDWPGIMIDRMEQLTGATTLFFNGAMGDVAPRTGSDRVTGDGEVALWEAGARASLDAVRAWRSIKDLRDAPLGVLTRGFEMPYRPLPSIEQCQRELAAAEQRKDEPGRGMCEYLHWRAAVAEHEAGPRPGKRFVQTVVALGPVAIVPFPGEPFTEIVLRMREGSPFQHTLCAAATGGSNGYLWSQEQLCRGGYEPWVARAFGPRLLAENIDDVLIDENLGLLRQLHAQMNPPLPTS